MGYCILALYLLFFTSPVLGWLYRCVSYCRYFFLSGGPVLAETWKKLLILYLTQYLQVMFRVFLIVCYFLHQVSGYVLQVFKVASCTCMIVTLTHKVCSAQNTLTPAGFLLVYFSYLICILAWTTVQWLQFEHSFLSSWTIFPNTSPSWCVITQET